MKIAIRLVFTCLLWGLYFILATPVSADTRCPVEKPDHAPDLFQIDMTIDSASLFFTPVNNAVTGYLIAYGHYRGDDRFGVFFPSGPSDGVISFKIDYLQPNTRYYFRVQAVNDCRNGFWSDTLSARTNWGSKKYYRVK
ncbi:MAG: hypothetical protein A2784_03060 [Candidatus Chisholmbacteria bacterium RIFCSPHIGHO2_01_FULL_48_12]|uniref:Fibronectin type-III domain-containing protein n=1 Tax=Candidatus Chisholmbacteria bacterium RIFCSPHIGHO2_01_FULL_48_12 TaxID=1797589 RepID=A0A1G1VNT3_9BACT|nr:MAG: hypothetical protein A2784_03060 [Candidatus Chisholmbacteria bacterium RIFCSPHIGHO2_01_FULL_48_12]